MQFKARKIYQGKAQGEALVTSMGILILWGSGP